jgi:WD40 repeat protein/serine/threonine protein kinase/two-component SAPR family response regulator
MATLSLSLLGLFQACLDEQPIPGFQTRKVQALLIYLAAEPAKHPRESLMDLMWPGMPNRSARHNLRQVLYYLRAAIPELQSNQDGRQDTVPFLLTNRQTIQLNPQASVTVDVAQFESLVNGVQAHEHLNVLTCETCLTNLEKAVDIYQGDFLIDYYLDDSNAFEDWAQVTRDAYRRKVLDALELLTAAATRQGDYPKAQALAKRQLEIDDLRENAYRQLMEALALSGHREEALAVYEDCRRILAEELSMEPANRTTEMARKIQSGDLSFETPLVQGVRGYELKEEIGAGAFGAIHRAYQLTVDREVAVKVIHHRYANDPEFIRRFEDEAQIVARLEHPYIVPLYDYWRDLDGAYLVMRYLKGGSLLSALQKTPWDVEAAGQMLDQVASALSAAHRQGVIHGDIKPANILLDEAGNAYLSDFGIAKNLGGARGLIAAKVVLGTPEYISPEQILNEDVGPRSDIYSLGAVLFETLTGERPFGDSSVANQIYRQLNDPLPLVSASRPDLPPQIDNVIQKATAKRPVDRYQDALEMAEAFRRSWAGSGLSEMRSVPAAMPMGVEQYNPYKGLQAFQEADTDDFYGRNALVDRLIERLASADSHSPKGKRAIGRSLDGDRFLALVGPSGSGKSSVVKAGLIPALRSGAVPNSDGWFYADMVPGTHPLEELEMALWPVAVDAPPSLVEPMQRDVRGMLRTIRRILPQVGDGQDAQLLLVIDQFEELFTLVDDEGRRNFFLDSLLEAISAPRSPLRVVITLRADFYDRPLEFQALGKLLKGSTEIVLPMTPEELTWAVREPAQSMGVALEEGLAEVIVADVAGQPGSLPLMQYALTELYERRRGNQMTREAYQEIGGVSGALGRRAEELYESLDDDEREAARQLFLRLVTLGEGVEDTRRRVLRSELAAIVSADNRRPAAGDVAPVADQQPAVITRMIDFFGAARLLTFDHDPATRGATVEVAHEALLREWARLRSWLDDCRDDIRSQRRLTRAAAEWLAADKDESYLLHGTRLAQFEGWSEASGIALTQDENAFLEASIGARKARQAAEEARRHQELKTAQKLAETEKARAEAEFGRAEEQASTARRLRQRAIGLAIVLVIAVGLAVLALVFGRASSRNAALAATREAEAVASAAEAQNVALVSGAQAALAKHDTDTALALAWQAVALNPDSALAQSQLSEAAYSPGTVRRFVGHTDFVTAVALSPDERTMLSASWDHELIFWDMATGEILWRRDRHTDSINDVAVSPDGRTAVSASEDKTVILWDVQTGQFIRQFDDYNGAVVAAEFSPDGRTIVAGGWDDELPLIRWDIETGQVIRRYEGDATGMQNIEFTPDGSAILSGSNDGKLILWDAQTGEIINQMDAGLDEASGSLREIAISPDGLTVAAGLANSEVLLWDLETGELIRRYQIDVGGAQTIAFHPNNGTLLIGGLSGNLIILDLQTGEILSTLTGHHETIMDLAIMHNARYVISASGDKTLRLWDLDGGNVIRRFAESGKQLFEVDLSPDERTALSGSADGTVTLWDVETGEVIRQFTDDQPVMAVTYSPDGRTALIGTGYRLAQKIEPGHVILWDLETGEEIRRFVGHPYVVYDVEFSPDGKRAVSSGNGAIVILWDVETGREIRRFEDYFVDSPWPIESFWDVKFSPDGRTILASHSKGPLILWDVETGAEISQLVGHVDSGATGITFTADGQRAVSGGWDSQAILWDVQSGEIIRRFTDPVGPVGQVRFTPDESLMLGGSGDGTASLWNVETGEIIRRYGNGFVKMPVFTDDGSQALVGFLEGAVELWRMDTTLDELLTWTQANRYIPELTCERRLFYGIEPLCEPEA